MTTIQPDIVAKTLAKFLQVYLANFIIGKSRMLIVQYTTRLHGELDGFVTIPGSGRLVPAGDAVEWRGPAGELVFQFNKKNPKLSSTKYRQISNIFLAPDEAGDVGLYLHNDGFLDITDPVIQEYWDHAMKLEGLLVSEDQGPA